MQKEVCMKRKIVLCLVLFLVASGLVIAGGAQEESTADEYDARSVEADTTGGEENFGVEFLFPAKGSPLVPDSVFEKAPPYRIAMAHNGFGNTWRVQSVEEAKWVASKIPEIDEFIFVEANNDPALQVSQIQDLLTQDIDGLIIAAAGLDNTNAMISEAVSRGIPVVSVVEAISSDDYTVKIENDQYYTFGTALGEWMIDVLDGEGRVWMLEGIAGFPASEVRTAGFLDAIEGTGIEVTGKGYTDWSYEKTIQIVENLMITDPEPDAVWCAGGAQGRALIRVYQENGLDLVPVTGESENGFFRVWTETDVTAAAAPFPPSLIAAGVYAVVDVLTGEPVHKDYIHRPDPITKEDRAEFFKPELSDEYWFPTNLPEEILEKMYGN
jgi:ribose transport system substrate-binding protein